MDDRSLRRAGLKVTVPRRKVLKVMEGSSTRHLSAEDIYRQLLAANEDVGLPTVYRVLAQLEAAGLVIRHYFADGLAVFELGSARDHDHIVCQDCGRIEEFVDEGLGTRQAELAKTMGFLVNARALILYGHSRSVAMSLPP